MDKFHYVLLVLTAVITACQFIATNFPGTQTAAIAHAVAGVCASLMPMLGALSGQLVGNKPAPTAPGPVAAAVVAQDAATVAKLNPAVHS